MQALQKEEVKLHFGKKHSLRRGPDDRMPEEGIIAQRDAILHVSRSLFGTCPLHFTSVPLMDPRSNGPQAFNDSLNLSTAVNPKN